MKAAVCRAFRTPLTIEDVQLVEPRTGEIRVRLRACGVCHSDISFIEGAWDGRLPAIYGHEAAGIVASVGERVTRLHPGDHVVVTLVRSCSRCYFCLRGLPVACEATFISDGASPVRTQDGTPVKHGLHTAAFAEEVVVDASQAVAIPDSVPMASAALIACAVLTGYGAVVNTAGIEPGSTVVVIGTGGVGLNTVQGAALAGAQSVIAVDPAPAKQAAARTFGAHHTINPKDADLQQAVLDLTGGRGADYVFVTVGVPSAIQDGLPLMRRGGTLVLVGMPPIGVTSAFDPLTIADNGQRILGSKMGAARIQTDVPALISLYQQGRLKVDELVSGRYPLARINDAIADTLTGSALRNVIVFG